MLWIFIDQDGQNFENSYFKKHLCCLHMLLSCEKVKGYLLYKTISWNKIALVINISEEKIVLFLAYLDFVFCEIHRFQNLWHHHKHCCINGSYTYAFFFWILNTIKIKFGQILMCCTANKFLLQCWRLETSSRPFHDITKMIISPLECPLFTFSIKRKKWKNGILT